MATIIASTYELIKKIGSGGGGVVYLANHIRLGKKVVLKADKRKITTRPEVLRREVDALKNLSHTYIPQVYDFFIEGETVYTVIDYIEGESLDRPLKRKERFTQAQVIKWACELLEALCYLHNPVHGTPPRGIVHSDIKPANIMLTSQGDICLIDFNIALALGEESVVGLSAGYASPEHYGLDFSTDSSFTSTSKSISKELEELETDSMRSINSTKTDGEKKVTMSMRKSEYTSSEKKIIIPDARSDIYSLGATLYHLLSGVRPARNAVDVVPISDEGVSPLISKIISKSMNPNPDLRYQTAEEMLYDFTHLRKNDPRTKKRKRTFLATSGILLFLILGGTFTSFVGLKRMEATQKSLALAEYSKNILDTGDRDLAIQSALEALPTERSIFIPPYIAQAKKALADSLNIYDLSDGYKPYHMIKLPSETLKTVLSPDGKTGAAIYAFELAIFDTETGEIKTTLPIIKSALSDVVYIDNDTIVYAGIDGITLYNIESNSAIWKGKIATHIAVSADGKTIAGIYRDETFATIYDINGNEKVRIDFNGNKQRVIENDTFGDPKDNLMALNNNGQYLAVSFENGALIIFDIAQPDDYIEIYDESDFIHFEGGFKGNCFAFSSTMDGLSEFGVIDMDELEYLFGFELDSLIGVKANEDNIYLSNKNTIVTIDPLTAEQEEVAFVDADVRMFSSDLENTIVATQKNDYLFYDKHADLITQYNAGQTECTFVDIAGDYAVTAGRDTPSIRILKRNLYDTADVCKYNPEYAHDEARFKDDGTRLIIFNYENFVLYDNEGNVIKEVVIPNSDKVYDQQYIRESGNLAVIYNDAFRLYSGENGDLIYEQTDLKSAFYAAYGVSTLDNSNNLKLIDLNTGEILISEKANGYYGAYCGMVVDSEFLEGAKLIGAKKSEEGYIFAVAQNELCKVYDDKGREKFEVPVLEQTEAFFTDNEIILSPLHGTPTVYSLRNGKKVADLEKDSYLTYVTQLEDYIVTEYTSSNGRYAILLDKNTYESLAYLPSLTDISNGELIFDYNKGVLRKSPIYSIDELLKMAYSN